MNDKNLHHDLTGGCLCGRIRFHIKGPCLSVVNCHCRTCQQVSGAPYLSLADWPKTAVIWLSEEPARYRSSDIAERGFCPHCGTTLTFEYLGGENIDLPLTALDDPDALAPQAELWTRSRRKWIKEFPDLLQYHTDSSQPVEK